MMNKEKRAMKNRCFKYLGTYGKNIKTKFNNICNKTGKYNVPDELFQKRTSRKNRVLISWKSVKKNNLDINKLNTFKNGVVVEFLNNDFFDESNQNNQIFIELKNRLGSDENVSSIISFRTENGSSSSAIPRNAFSKFIEGTEVVYKGKKIIVDKDNYRQYALKKLVDGHGSGIGNEKWSGFLFASIKGGEHDTIETHSNNVITLFNPACEYANEDVIIDIDLTLSYFALKSIDCKNLPDDKKQIHNQLIEDLSCLLKKIKYELNFNLISLYDYCINHPSVAIDEEKLTDAIQLKEISISHFNITANVPESIDLTHNEAVNKENYYWDENRNCILSPARPTNLFWSYHLSNMMQQDFNLMEYVEYEEKVYNKRQNFKEYFELTKDV